MASRLRILGLRVALVWVAIAAVLAMHIVVAKRSLPLALFDSFDQAFELAYSAAERRVAELEAARPTRLVGEVTRLIDELERAIAQACDVASAELDVELAMAGALPDDRRRRVLSCIEYHLGQARDAVTHATDPSVRAEYSATCEHLLQVRQMI